MPFTPLPSWRRGTKLKTGFSTMASSILEVSRLTRLRTNWKGRLTDHLKGGFGSTVVAQLGVLGLGTFTGVAAARLLGPQGRGELAALVLWPSVLVMLFSLGINQAVVFHAGQKLYGISEVWTASLFVCVMQCLLVVMVGLLVVPRALHAYSPETRHLALIFLATTPLLMFSGYPSSLLQGKLDFLSFNVIRMIPTLVYALGLAFLLLVRVVDLQKVVAFQILGYAAAVAVGVWILLRKEKLRFSLKKAVLNSLLSYGLKTQFATVTSYVNQRVDQLLLSLLVSPQELGLYVVAVTVSLALSFLPQASAMVTLAAGSNLPRAGAKAVICGSFRTSLIWLVVGCSALFVVAPWLITLVFGASFIRSGLACRILLPGSIALGLNQVLYEGARSLNDPALPSYSEGVAAILTGVGLYLLLPRFGFIGAAIASTLAYILSLVFTLVLYRLRLRYPLRELLPGFPGPAAARTGS
jgi:O-antigen/teichoic acid export membrane protein